MLTFAPGDAAQIQPANGAGNLDLGVITGQVLDFDTKEPVPYAVVLVECECLDETLEVVTDPQGLYRAFNLPAGTYTITVRHADNETIRLAELPQDASFRVDFSVGQRLVTPERQAQIKNGQLLKKAGVGVMAAGGVFAVGAILSTAISPCGFDGAEGTNCRTDTRTYLTAGFGVASVATIAAGIALYATGKRRERGLYASAAGNKHGGMLVLSGRF